MHNLRYTGAFEIRKMITTSITLSPTQLLSRALESAADSLHDDIPDAEIVFKANVDLAITLLHSGKIVEEDISIGDLTDAAAIGNIDIFNLLLSFPSVRAKIANQNNAVFNCAAIKERFDIIKLLLAKDKFGQHHFPLVVNGLKNLPYSLHTAVKVNDINLVTLLISEGKKINERDDKGRTPLFYAQNEGIIKYLLKHGASPHAIDKDANDLIIRQRHLKNVSLVKSCKTLLGFDSKKLSHFYLLFKNFLKKELSIAKKQKKKILIMIGEVHNHYPVCQIESVILKVASKLKINTLLYELDQQTINEALQLEASELCHHGAKLVKNSKVKLGMSVKGIDALHRVDSTSLKPRNVRMSKEILKENKNAVVIIGAAHLKGLLQDEASKITKGHLKQYHIIPFNLTTLCYTPEKITEIINQERDKEKELSTNFLFDQTKVIQVSNPPLSANITLSSSKPIISLWNAEKEKQSSHSMGAPKKSLKKKTTNEIDGIKAFKKRKILTPS